MPLISELSLSITSCFEFDRRVNLQPHRDSLRNYRTVPVKVPLGEVPVVETPPMMLKFDVCLCVSVLRPEVRLSHQQGAPLTHCPPLPPCSYNKRDVEAAGAQARVKDLEAQLNAKDATLSTALSEKRNLEARLADLQEQLQEVQHAHQQHILLDRVCPRKYCHKR